MFFFFFFHGVGIIWPDHLRSGVVMKTAYLLLEDARERIAHVLTTIWENGANGNGLLNNHGRRLL